MLTLRDPFSDFPPLFPTYRRFNSNGASTAWVPPMDTIETDDAIHLKVEVPGLTMEDLNVEVSSGVITISGERRYTADNATRREMRYGKFQRALRLPNNANVESVDAVLDNGILTVTIPYAYPKRTTIAIRAPDLELPPAA